MNSLVFVRADFSDFLPEPFDLLLSIDPMLNFCHWISQKLILDDSFWSSPAKLRFSSLGDPAMPDNPMPLITEGGP